MLLLDRDTNGFVIDTLTSARVESYGKTSSVSISL